jgi:hypothetical protein
MSPTVTKFPKLPKLILLVKKHVFNIQIRKNSFYKTANLTRVLIKVL